jgi:hypothetical protein
MPEETPLRYLIEVRIVTPSGNTFGFDSNTLVTVAPETVEVIRVVAYEAVNETLRRMQNECEI